MLNEPADLAVRRATDGASVKVSFTLSPELRYFTDHFSGHPMLPGVVQLAWAVEQARRAFALQAPVKSVSALKFQHPLMPGAQVTLALQREADGRVVFSYTAGSQRCSSGRLSFENTFENGDG